MQGERVLYLNKELSFDKQLGYFNSYILSLEAWRKGLKLHFSIEDQKTGSTSSGDDKLFFVLSDDEKTILFKGIHEKELYKEKAKLSKATKYNLSLEGVFPNKHYDEYGVFFMERKIVGTVGRCEKNNISEVIEQMDESMKSVIIEYISHLNGWRYGILLIKYNQEESQLSVHMDFSPDSLKDFLFPTIGDAINIPKKILNSYNFKYNKEMAKKSPHLTFNLKEVLMPIIKGASTKVKLPTVKDVENKKGVRILINNVNYSLMDLKWMRNICREYFTTGFMQKTIDGHIEIVTLTKEDIVNQLKVRLASRFNQNIEIQISPWNGAIPIGFEFIGLKEMLIELLKEIEESHERNVRRRDKLELQREQLKNSLSWKLTRPIRYITGLLKK